MDRKKLIDQSFKLNEKAVEEAAQAFYKNNMKPGHIMLIGHVTLIHLICEKLLVEYIEKANPNFPDLAPLQLGYYKILEIAAGLKGNYKFNSKLVKPLRALNALRNALAHRPALTDVPDHPFKSIEEFYLDVTPISDRKEMDTVQLLDWFLGFVAGAMHVSIDAVELISSLESRVKLLTELAERETKSGDSKGST